MAEKIVNGTFDTDLSSWNNIGQRAFVWSAGKARARSLTASASPATSVLTQPLGVSGVVLAASLTVAIAWDVPGGEADGAVEFNAKLITPGGATIVIGTSTKYAGSGAEYLCDHQNIAPHMTTIGTYTLRIEAICSSSEDEAGFEVSTGFVDGISIVATERFFKTVLEGIGGAEMPSRLGVGVVEGAGLSEDLAGIQGKFLRSKMGLQEDLNAIVEGNALEGAGLAESYSTHVGKRRTVPTEGAGLDESLLARWRVGNVTQERDVLAADDIWEDLDTVDTYWETI